MTGRRYEEKVAVVTGGASGIGRATVAALAAEGGRVVFTDLNEDAGKSFERELADAGREVLFLRADGTREDDVVRVLGTTVERFGRLDVAINNVGGMGAGDAAKTPLHEADADGFRATLELTVTSVFLGMKHEIAYMREHGGGAIANTASLAALRYSPSSSAGYLAAKAGVVHLTKHAAVRYGRDKIRVNAVAPGMTLTPAVFATFGSEGADELAAKDHPLGRAMRPEEIAEAFLWLCSDDAGGVSGMTIAVDGGWSAR